MQKFEPDQLVLVKFVSGGPWRLRRYSMSCDKVKGHETQDGVVWPDYCILPYSGNEHLLGTTESPAPKWKPKPGELVAARNKHDIWLPAIFCDRKRLLTGEEAFSIQWFDRTERLVEEVEPLHEHFNMPG